MLQNILIATPSHSGTSVMAFAGSLAETIQALQSTMGIHVAFLHYDGCSLIDHARNVLLGEFLKTAHDAILFIDDDMSWRYTDVIAVASAPERFPVAGAAYRGRYEKPEQFMFLPVAEEGAVRAHHIGTLVGSKTFVEVEWAGTGFLLVTRAAAQKAWDASKEYVLQGTTYREVFQRPKALTQGYIGEDVQFGHLLSSFGFSQLVCIDSNVTHHGKKAFYANEVRPWLASRYRGL